MSNLKNKPLLNTTIILFWFLFGLLVSTVTDPAGFGDSDYYFKMANDPFNFAGSPWGYRIAVPYMISETAALLHLEISNTFQILQHIAYALFIFLLHLWLTNHLKISNSVSIFSCLLFAVSYPAIYYLHNFIHIGFFEYIAIIIGVMLMHRRKDILFALLILVSIPIKETIGLILIPTYFLFSIFQEKKSTAFYKSLVIGTIYLAGSIVLRSGLVFFNDVSFSSYSSFYNSGYLNQVRDATGGLVSIAKVIVTTFGPTLIIAIPGFIAAPRQLQLLLIIPILAAAQVMLATDISRMITIGLPIIVTYCAFTFNLVSLWKRMALTLTACVYILGKNKGIAEYGEFIAILFFVICCCITLYLLLPLLRNKLDDILNVHKNLPDEEI